MPENIDHGDVRSVRHRLLDSRLPRSARGKTRLRRRRGRLAAMLHEYSYGGPIISWRCGIISGFIIPLYRIIMGILALVDTVPPAPRHQARPSWFIFRISQSSLRGQTGNTLLHSA